MPVLNSPGSEAVTRRANVQQDVLCFREQVQYGRQLEAQGREIGLCLFFKGIRSQVLKWIRWSNVMSNA